MLSSLDHWIASLVSANPRKSAGVQYFIYLVSAMLSLFGQLLGFTARPPTWTETAVALQATGYIQPTPTKASHPRSRPRVQQ